MEQSDMSPWHPQAKPYQLVAASARTPTGCTGPVHPPDTLWYRLRDISIQRRVQAVTHPAPPSRARAPSARRCTDRTLAR